MDNKTRLLDENATLEQRRKKDKVSLDKVSVTKKKIVKSYLTFILIQFYNH